MKIIIFVVTFLLSQSLWALNIEQPVLDKILAANYEVVIAKPTKDVVEYERELPLHLLPFRYRNDKYYSVGSAFRIDGNKFVSAAHVLELGAASQDKDISLRDSNGKIYPIDKIYKYSRAKDFVVFTIKGVKPGKGLTINTNYSKNKKVNAVGNALGEGVVIRDGLYTSDTPEARAGEWNWIRFSAAASPGNSGGPLLDDKGNVIGVILQKSESENLNYALPMSEILKFKQVAELKSKSMTFKIDISNDTHSFDLDRSHKLPLSIEKIDLLLQNDMQEVFQKAADDFLVKHKKRLFPNDEGSMPLLYNRYTSFFPSIVIKGSDKIWDIFRPKNIKKSDTGNGGRVNYGKLGSFYYFKLKRPNNVDVKKYYSDSKILMDQILKGVGYKREIGNESVPIISIGKSIENRTHVDSFGRKWQVRNWLVSFNDKKFVMYALPTPDGYAIMMSITNTGKAKMMEIDMKIIVDNLYYTYYGTLSDWTTFLEQKNITPEFTKNVSINTDEESYIQYEDKNFNLRIDSNVMKISKNSDIQLRCSYYKNEDKVIWAPVMIAVGENKHTTNYASVSRNIKPPQILDERYRVRWGDITEKRSPYNSKTYIKEQMSNITLLRANHMDSLNDNDVIYAISWHESGTIEHSVMESKVKKLQSNFKMLD